MSNLANVNAKLITVLGLAVIGLLITAILLMVVPLDRSDDYAVEATPLPVTPTLSVAMPLSGQLQIEIEGPSHYPDPDGGRVSPYIAEYRLRLVQQATPTPVTITMTCVKCIRAIAAGNRVVLGPGVEAVVRSGVVEGPATFAVSVYGAECLRWSLSPSDTLKMFKSICEPELPPTSAQEGG